MSVALGWSGNVQRHQAPIAAARDSAPASGRTAAPAGAHLVTYLLDDNDRSVNDSIIRFAIHLSERFTISLIKFNTV